MYCFTVLLLVSIWHPAIHATEMISEPSHFYGAWEMKTGKTTSIKIYTPGYFIYSVYDTDERGFLEAGGGTWQMTTNGLSEKYEFQTSRPEWVSLEIMYDFVGSHEHMTMKLKADKGDGVIEEKWTRIDDGSSPLFGAWRITQRERNGEMGRMSQGPRKTMKVLSGTRFQWAAFNVETREFSGTGGGTFTAENGKYTENIAFFSRDNSRVGASLEFDFSIDGNDWHHKGLSSRGEPIYEIWTKQDN